MGNSTLQTTKMTNYRWVICAMLFFATTVNYMDRQVLSLTWKDFIAPEFHWTDSDYGTITGAFSLFYAIFCLFAGKFIDWMGTKKGYLWAIFIWSTGACLHAICGWVTMNIEGIDSLTALRAVEDGSQAALAIASVSVWLFLSCRMILALGEAGNFPAAIKVTAEYFPKKDRAFATSIFNAGASVGALLAPATIPILARACGWEMAFVIIGALGYVWMFLWVFVYDKPNKQKHVNAAELTYINQDAETEGDPKDAQDEGPAIGFLKCFTFKQTWAFIVGKFMTDGVWWFFLFWAPAYFSDQYGYTSDSTMGILLIFTLYAIVTVISIGGGYLPTYFVDKKGMNPYAGRMRAMLIFACFPVVALIAQPMGAYSAWWPAIIIGFVGAGHQAWSANLFSTIGDMFPKSAIATVTGIGAMAGGIGSLLINKGAGMLFDYSAGSFIYGGKENIISIKSISETFGVDMNLQSSVADMVAKIQEMGGQITNMPMDALGFDGKPAGYMIIFCICAVAYLIGWTIMKVLVPKYKPIIVE